ncbi:MAG TPA: B-box zinc finger protein [Methylomirabilota bacterium]|nr:B-box zinc finger protein [Methylomirabilota bacterium]
MNCATHTDQDASNFCRNCGKALCPACVRSVQGVPYCEDCLAALVGHGHPAAAAVPVPQPAAHTGPIPALAFALGFCPGLGAIYNGEYTKAIAHIAIFAGLIWAISSGDWGPGGYTALGLLLAAFVFYMPVDALRVAQARRGQAVAGTGASTDPLQTWGQGKPLGAFILIGLGILFLLSTFDILSWDRIWDYWPVILIAAGVLMLWNRLGKSS